MKAKKKLAQPRLVKEWEDLGVWEYPNEPGIYELRTKRDIGELHKGKLHSRATHDVFLFWCKDCRCEHHITRKTFEFTESLMRSRNIAELLMLCIDGELHFWQPGAPPYEGKRVCLLIRWELRWF